MSAMDAAPSFPDPPAFADVVGDDARLARVAAIDAHEGPVFVPEQDALYFTSVPAPDVAIKRLSLSSGEVSVLRAHANRANGMTLHPDGRLLVCEQGTHSSPARITSSTAQPARPRPWSTAGEGCR